MEWKNHITSRSIRIIYVNFTFYVKFTEDKMKFCHGFTGVTRQSTCTLDTYFICHYYIFLSITSFNCIILSYVHRIHWEKMWNPCYEICNCTTKSIVYPYYFDTIPTIIMDNQKSILFPIKVHTISILWIFNFFPVIVNRCVFYWHFCTEYIKLFENIKRFKSSILK